MLKKKNMRWNLETLEHFVQTANRRLVQCIMTPSYRSFTTGKWRKQEPKGDWMAACCCFTGLAQFKALFEYRAWCVEDVTAPLRGARGKWDLSCFLCLLAVIRSLCCHAAVAPIITPTLSGEWVDGCANLSVPCSSPGVRTAAPAAVTIHYTHMELLEYTCKQQFRLSEYVTNKANTKLTKLMCLMRIDQHLHVHHLN